MEHVITLIGRVPSQLFVAIFALALVSLIFGLLKKVSKLFCIIALAVSICFMLPAVLGTLMDKAGVRYDAEAMVMITADGKKFDISFLFEELKKAKDKIDGIVDRVARSSDIDEKLLVNIGLNQDEIGQVASRLPEGMKILEMGGNAVVSYNGKTRMLSRSTLIKLGLLDN